MGRIVCGLQALPWRLGCIMLQYQCSCLEECVMVQYNMKGSSWFHLQGPSGSCHACLAVTTLCSGPQTSDIRYAEPVSAAAFCTRTGKPQSGGRTAHTDGGHSPAQLLIQQPADGEWKCMWDQAPQQPHHTYQTVSWSCLCGRRPPCSVAGAGISESMPCCLVKCSRSQSHWNSSRPPAQQALAAGEFRGDCN